MSGKFIVLEGLDGSGKSTQARLLADRLNERGVPAVLTAEPTDGETGRLIRAALRGEYDFSAAALSALFLRDRIEHNIRPGTGVRAQLEAGITVVSDRYYYSSMAYQGMESPELFDRVVSANLSCRQIAAPGLCVFLDVPPEKCIERLIERQAGGKRDIFENTDSLIRIRECFGRVFDLMLEAGQNILILDASESPGQISDRILKAVLAL